jgi:hypothetical protein
MSEDAVRTVTRSILTAGAIVIMVGPAAAQEPERIRQAVLIAGGRSAAAARSSFAVSERLMSFDANKDKRISRDELPDRMQGLIARGDKNGDSTLDLEEIGALVTMAASERTRVFFRPPSSDGLPGVISDLKLSPAKREQALGLLSAHPPVPQVKDGNTEFYKAMRSLLDDEEYENFVAAAERLSKTAPIRF